MKKNVHAENDLIQKEKVSLDSGDKGGKIKTFMSTAGQKTQELLQGIVEKTEQNGDGKVVLENAAALVNSAELQQRECSQVLLNLQMKPVGSMNSKS